jgi:hypothetical protein
MQQMATAIDQLDLAFEHVEKGDANNARFALVLTDNLVEITLHRFAERSLARQKSSFRHSHQGTPIDPLLVDANRRNFDAKVKYLRSTDRVSHDMSQSIVELHLFRNDVYHVGLQHEPVLSALSNFYFRIACDVLVELAPTSWGYSPGMKLPERAQKYFGNVDHFMDGPEQYKKACAELKAKAVALASSLSGTLSSHMFHVTDEYDGRIDFFATGGPERRTRDQVIVDCQVWPFAFTEKGKQYARENGCPPGSVLQFIEWLAANYKWPFPNDPIMSWRARATRVERENDEHKALTMYRSFMDQTESIRELIDESALQLDAEIDRQIDMARGK